MAHLLNHSEGSFLSVKLTIGALAAYTLYRCADIPIARRGMKLVLGIYLVLMFVSCRNRFFRHSVGTRPLQCLLISLACPKPSSLSSPGKTPSHADRFAFSQGSQSFN